MGLKEIYVLTNKNISNNNKDRQRLIVESKVNKKDKKDQIWESFSKRGEHATHNWNVLDLIL